MVIRIVRTLRNTQPRRILKACSGRCRRGLCRQIQRRQFTLTIGVIGYCMGGRFAMLLAPGHGFSASSANYETVPKDADRFLPEPVPLSEVLARWTGR